MHINCEGQLTALDMNKDNSQVVAGGRTSKLPFDLSFQEILTKDVSKVCITNAYSQTCFQGPL